MGTLLDILKSLFSTTVQGTTPDNLQALIAGLAKGSIYALVAVGFTVIFSSTQVVNFAQGEFVMIGAMVTYWLAESQTGPHWTNLASGATAVLIALLIGGLLGWVLMRVRKNTSPTTLIIITIGTSMLLQGLASMFWDVESHNVTTFSQPYNLEFPMQSHSVYLITQYIWIWAFTAVIVLALIFFFNFTIQGKAMRAVAANQHGARLVGINTSRMVIFSFSLSAVIGALGGVVYSPIAASYDMGPLLGLKGFAAAIVGGLGSFPGSIVAGLLLGISEEFFCFYKSSQYKDALAFIILLLVLFISPNGITALFRRRRARA